MFVIFRVTPYSKDIAKSLKKEPKYYFFNSGLVIGDDGAKFENAVACSLLKEVHRLSDVEGLEFKLHYLKVKGGREIDFLVLPNDKNLRPILIETKFSETDVSPNFKLFQSAFKNPLAIQLVVNNKRNFSNSQGVRVTNAAEWLSGFSLVLD